MSNSPKRRIERRPDLHRPERDLILQIIYSNSNSISKEDICEIMDLSKRYFNNKLFRSSFSINDLITIATIKGYQIKLISEKDEIVIDPFSFIDSLNVSDQIEKLKQQLNNIKQEEAKIINTLNELEEYK